LSSLSSARSKSVPKSPKHALSPVDILSGAEAVDQPFELNDLRPVERTHSAKIDDIKLSETL
jgi:hypothetical protein